MTLSKDIEENYKHFKNDFVDCSDFLVRKAKIGDKNYSLPLVTDL